MRILLTPDKFKGSLGAEEVGARMAAGLRAVLPQAEIEVAPVADGGEGTAEVIRRARRGEWRECGAHDALGRPLQTRYAWLASAETAVLEMSAAAGLAQLAPNERDPLRASTFGVGEMLRDAAARGARQILIGLGGSATNDGGFGLARALGFHFLDGDDQEISASVTDLPRLAKIKRPNELELPPIVAASDVRNPLLGPEGASHVFGPQKGAGPEAVALLEQALTRLAEVAAESLGCDHRIFPGAGAAGGLGFGLLTFCGATLRPGFDLVAEMIDLRRKIAWSEVVVTGEGQLDRQTLSGKAPAGVARMARALGKSVFAIVGQSTEDKAAHEIFDGVLTLGEPGRTAELLEARARELAHRLQVRFA